MNAALPNGKRIHQMRDGAPRCGGGGHGKRGPWQMDLGDVTCRRCQKLAECDAAREARGQTRQERAQQERNQG